MSCIGSNAERLQYKVYMMANDGCAVVLAGNMSPSMTNLMQERELIPQSGSPYLAPRTLTRPSSVILYMTHRIPPSRSQRT